MRIATSSGDLAAPSTSASTEVEAHFQLDDTASANIIRTMCNQGGLTLCIRVVRVDPQRGLVAIITLPGPVAAAYESYRDDGVGVQTFVSIASEPGNHGSRNVPSVAEPPAAARWARALVPLIDCPYDPRTVDCWGRWVSVSAGALRNWCQTAGIQPRKSLIFARLLRAVVLSDGGRHKAENILDVVDRRTLSSMLRLAGLTDWSLPKDVDGFLARQTMIDDGDALAAVRRALDERGRSRATS